MKRLLILLPGLLFPAACQKNDPRIPANDSPAEKVSQIRVPASFDWKTTRSVACDFTAPHASKIFVSAAEGAEPFATFIAGSAAEPVTLSVPAAARSLYVRYETETGAPSAEQTVPITNGRAAYALSAASGSKDYTGIDDGGKNSTEGNVIYMPARRNGWGTLLFEDLWPACGDYDFNDMVLNYKVQLYMNNKNMVTAMLIGLRVRAVGGSLPFDLHLSLRGVKGGEIDAIRPVQSANAPSGSALVALNSDNDVKEPAILRFENIRANANKPAGAAYVNTEEGYELSDGQLVSVSYLVEFRNSIPIDAVRFDTFDFYLGRTLAENGRRVEIHMGGFAPSPEAQDDYDALKAGNSNIGKALEPYYSNDRLVWALNIPSDIRHPYERVDFLQAYPQFETWAKSGGAQAPDWYEHGVAKKLVSKR